MIYRIDDSIIKIYKNEDIVSVYLSSKYPGEIVKKFTYISEFIGKKEDLIECREKLMAMKKNKNWPDFVVKPTNIGRMYDSGFSVRFPFIEGDTLSEYIRNNDISLLQCANLIKKMEEKIYPIKDMVFVDFANPGNIKIKENGNDLDFTLIDPDDIQFGDYISDRIAPLLAPDWEDFSNVFGLHKCFVKKRGPINYYTRPYSKELDIRSVYALLYYIIGNENFYPILYERKNINEYKEVLDNINIPRNSDLYEKSMLTLYNNKASVPIDDSLFELIDNGYEFETLNKNYRGFVHRLVRK